MAGGIMETMEQLRRLPADRRAVGVWDNGTKRGLWAVYDLKSLAEYIHFCRRDAVPAIMESGAILSPAECRRRGIACRPGHLAHWVSDEMVCVYAVAVARDWQNWGAMPRKLLEAPEEFVAIWFVAEPDLFWSRSDDEFRTDEPVPVADALVISVDEAFTLMGATLAAALASR